MTPIFPSYSLSMSDFNPDSLNITGGLPDGKDLAPSVIFIVLYCGALVTLVFRLCRRSDRGRILIYPALFIQARLAMLVIRAILSKSSSFNENLFIAESILVLVGPVFLLHPLVALFNQHVQPHVNKKDTTHWVNRISRILHLTLLGAVITGIVAGASISGALDDPSKMSTVVTLRKVSCILALIVSVFVLLAVVLARTRFTLSHSGTLYICLVSCIMIVIGVYRILGAFSTEPSAHVRSKAAFWILQITFEYFALVCYLAISIPLWFPGHASEIDAEDVSQKMGSTDVESGHTTRPSILRK